MFIKNKEIVTIEIRILEVRLLSHPVHSKVESKK